MAQGGQAAPLLGGNAAGGGCWDRFVGGLVAVRRAVWDGRTGYERTAVVAGSIVLTTGAVVGGVCGTGHCGSATPGSGPHHSAVTNSSVFFANASVAGGEFGPIRYNCSFGTNPDGTPVAPNGTLTFTADRGTVFPNGSYHSLSIAVASGKCNGTIYAGRTFPAEDSFMLANLTGPDGKSLAAHEGAFTVGPYKPITMFSRGVPPFRNFTLDESYPLRQGGFEVSFGDVPPLLRQPRAPFVSLDISLAGKAEGSELGVFWFGNSGITPDQKNGTVAFSETFSASGTDALAATLSGTPTLIPSKDIYSRPQNPNMTITLQTPPNGSLTVFDFGDSEGFARVPIQGGLAPWSFGHIRGAAPVPPTPPTPAQPVGFNGTLAASGLASGEAGHPAAAGNLSVYGLDGRNATLRLVGAAADAVTGDVTFALMAANGTVVNCTLQQGAAAGSSCAVELPGVPAASVDAVTSRLALVGSDNARRNKGSISFSVTAEGTGSGRTASIAAPWNVSAAPALPRPAFLGGPFNATGAPVTAILPFDGARVVNASNTLTLWVSAEAMTGASPAFLLAAGGKSTGTGSGRAALPALVFSSEAALQAAVRGAKVTGSLADGQVEAGYNVTLVVQGRTQFRHSGNGTVSGIAFVRDCPDLSLTAEGRGSASPGATGTPCGGLVLGSDVSGASYAMRLTFVSGNTDVTCPSGWTASAGECSAEASAEAAQAALRSGLRARPGFGAGAVSFALTADPTGNGTAGCPATSLPKVCEFELA